MKFMWSFLLQNIYTYKNWSLDQKNYFLVVLIFFFPFKHIFLIAHSVLFKEQKYQENNKNKHFLIILVWLWSKTGIVSHELQINWNEPR